MVASGSQAVRARMREVTGAATTLGFGPRFLHSTGQLHKGGPDTGVFLQLTADAARDLPIPGWTGDRSAPSSPPRRSATCARFRSAAVASCACTSPSDVGRRVLHRVEAIDRRRRNRLSIGT